MSSQLHISIIYAQLINFKKHTITTTNTTSKLIFIVKHISSYQIDSKTKTSTMSRLVSNQSTSILHHFHLTWITQMSMDDNRSSSNIGESNQYRYDINGTMSRKEYCWTYLILPLLMPRKRQLPKRRDI